MSNRTRFGLLIGLASAIGAALACSAKSEGRAPSEVAANGGTAGVVQTGRGGLTVGNSGTSSVIGNLDASVDPDAGSCQQAQVDFVPKFPTVFILVDRSGSMFEPATDAAGMQYLTWDRLRAAALPVIQNLQDQIRFGFGAFTGQAGMCPEFPTVAADLNNYEKIRELYASLGKPTYKAETPTMLVLPRVGEMLWTDPTPGDRNILFITDGEPDYCDDGNPLCPPDNVVYRLQRLFSGLDAQGVQRQAVKTFVLGLKSPLTTVSDASLQAWANAGQGQPVLPFGQAATDPNALYDQCNPVAPWQAEFATTGKPAMRGQSLGTYSTSGGVAKVYRPDAGDQSALTNEIAALVNNVKTCNFDLQGKIKVDLPKAGQGKVRIDGEAIPYDSSAANGWHMVNETQLALAGSACEKWRSTGMTINFDFPCDIIIVVK